MTLQGAASLNGASAGGATLPVSALRLSLSSLPPLSDELQARHGRWLLKLLAAMFSFAHVQISSRQQSSRSVLGDGVAEQRSRRALSDALHIVNFFRAEETPPILQPLIVLPHAVGSLPPKKLAASMASLVSDLWAVENLEAMCVLPLTPICSGEGHALRRSGHHAIKQALHQLWRTLSCENEDDKVEGTAAASAADPIHRLARIVFDTYFVKHPRLLVQKQLTNAVETASSAKLADGAAEQRLQTTAVSTSGDENNNPDNNNDTSGARTTRDAIAHMWQDQEPLVHWYQHAVKCLRLRPKAAKPSSCSAAQDAAERKRDSQQPGEEESSESCGWMPISSVIQQWKCPQHMQPPMWHGGGPPIPCGNLGDMRSHSYHQQEQGELFGRSLWELDLCLRLQFSREPKPELTVVDDAEQKKPLLVRATYMQKDATVAANVLTTHPIMTVPTTPLEDRLNSDTTGATKSTRYFDWIQLTEALAVGELTKHNGRFCPSFRPYLFCLPEALFTEEESNNRKSPGVVRIQQAALRASNFTQGTIVPELSRDVMWSLAENGDDAGKPRVTLRRLHRCPLLEENTAAAFTTTSEPVLMMCFDAKQERQELPSTNICTTSSSASLVAAATRANDTSCRSRDAAVSCIATPDGSFVVPLRHSIRSDCPPQLDVTLFTGWGFELCRGAATCEGACVAEQSHEELRFIERSDLALCNGAPQALETPPLGGEEVRCDNKLLDARRQPNLECVEQAVVQWYSDCVTSLCEEQQRRVALNAVMSAASEAEWLDAWGCTLTVRLIHQHSILYNNSSSFGDSSQPPHVAGLQKQIATLLKTLSKGAAPLDSRCVSMYLVPAAFLPTKNEESTTTTSDSFATEQPRQILELNLVMDEVGGVAIHPRRTTMMQPTDHHDAVEASVDAVVVEAEWQLMLVPKIDDILVTRFVSPMVAALAHRPSAPLPQPLDRGVETTMRSALMERLHEALDAATNDPLEFLGDAVVDYLFVMKYLQQQHHGGSQEGDDVVANNACDNRHNVSSLVGASGLGAFMEMFASNTSLGGVVFLGRGVRRHVALRLGVSPCDLNASKVFGDVAEAICGALFLHALVEHHLTITVALETVGVVMNV